MLSTKHIKDKVKISAFFIVPVLFAIIGLILHFSSGRFFLQRTDPEYLHLLNGVNIAVGNLAVEYIAHPGTIIEVIMALATHITNLIYPGSSFLVKVIENPEAIIHISSILSTFVTSFVLLLIGYKYYKKTGNLFESIALQLIPFASYRILLMTGRLIPETFLIFPLLLLTYFVLMFSLETDKDKVQNKYLILFALAEGLGMSAKFSWLPMLIVPFFVLNNFNAWKKYILYTTISVIVFAFPVFVNISKSWDWFFGMLTHSGRWGEGSNSFIDTGSFFDNFNKLINLDKSIIIIALIALIINIIIRLSKKSIKFNKTILNFNLAIIIVLFISMVLVSKHFAVHYFVPFMALKFILIFSIFILIKDIKLSFIRKFMSPSLLVLLLVLSFMQFTPFKASFRILQNESLKYENRYQQLKQYNKKENVLIITSHYRGSPFVQSALVDSYLINGHLKYTFKDELIKHYPKTYFFFDWTDNFYFWDDFIPTENMPIDKDFYVFIGDGKDKNLEIIEQRFKDSFSDMQIKKELVEKLENPNEYLYKFSIEAPIISVEQ